MAKLGDILKEKPNKKCPICGKEFFQPPLGPNKIFCSRACAKKYWVLKAKLKRLTKRCEKVDGLKKQLERIERIAEENRKKGMEDFR